MGEERSKPKSETHAGRDAAGAGSGKQAYAQKQLKKGEMAR